MSRTDNTDPHWVRAAWWEPWHRSCRFATFFGGEPCDLPAEPVVSATYGATWRGRHGATRCFWRPTWDGMITGGGWSAPPWFNRIEFTAPERCRVRNQLTRARQEHRATGEVDVIVEAAQHRHRGDRAWW